MITIVDYGAGNVESVRKALMHLGADARLSRDPAEIEAAELVFFPGQGQFGQAMGELRARGLEAPLRRVLAAGTPFIGVCLGLQLLFEGSDEAPGVAGLGFLPGRCVAFAPPLKIPHIGWNRVDRARPAGRSATGSPLDHVADGAHYYFVHTFHAQTSAEEIVVATADYDTPFTAAVMRDNLFATQFHPEKSGAAGLALLAACLRWHQGGR